MANRSYLYTVDAVPTSSTRPAKCFAVSEWAGAVSVVQMLLVGTSPRVSASVLSRDEIGIVGPVGPGVSRCMAFLDRLLVRAPDDGVARATIERAMAFLLNARLGGWFLLEAGEVVGLQTGDLRAGVEKLAHHTIPSTIRRIENAEPSWYADACADYEKLEGLGVGELSDSGFYEVVLKEPRRTVQAGECEVRIEGLSITMLWCGRPAARGVIAVAEASEPEDEHWSIPHAEIRADLDWVDPGVDEYSIVSVLYDDLAKDLGRFASRPVAWLDVEYRSSLEGGGVGVSGRPGESKGYDAEYLGSLLDQEVTRLARKYLSIRRDVQAHLPEGEAEREVRAAEGSFWAAVETSKGRRLDETELTSVLIAGGIAEQQARRWSREICLDDDDDQVELHSAELCPHCGSAISARTSTCGVCGQARGSAVPLSDSNHRRAWAVVALLVRSNKLELTSLRSLASVVAATATVLDDYEGQPLPDVAHALEEAWLELDDVAEVFGDSSDIVAVLEHH